MTQVAEHINEVKEDYKTSLLVQVMYMITIYVYVYTVCIPYVCVYMHTITNIQLSKVTYLRITEGFNLIKIK